MDEAVIKIYFYHDQACVLHFQWVRVIADKKLAFAATFLESRLKFLQFHHLVIPGVTDSNELLRTISSEPGTSESGIIVLNIQRKIKFVFLI